MIQTEYRSGQKKELSWGHSDSQVEAPPSSAAAGGITSLGIGLSCHTVVRERQDMWHNKETTEN